MRFVLLLMSALIVGSCATMINQSTPPENYKGPIAAQPVIQQGDYWINERGDSTRVKSYKSNLQLTISSLARKNLALRKWGPPA